MKPKYSIDQTLGVNLNTTGAYAVMRITQIGNFGDQPHYGFYTFDNPIIAGWIPVALLDNMQVEVIKQ